MCTVCTKMIFAMLSFEFFTWHLWGTLYIASKTFSACIEVSHVKYFNSVRFNSSCDSTLLQDPTMMVQHKTWAVFVMSSVVRNYKQGQDEAVAGNY